MTIQIGGIDTQLKSCLYNTLQNENAIWLKIRLKMPWALMTAPTPWLKVVFCVHTKIVKIEQPSTHLCWHFEQIYFRTFMPYGEQKWRSNKQEYIKSDIWKWLSFLSLIFYQVDRSLYDCKMNCKSPNGHSQCDQIVMTLIIIFIILILIEL